MTPGRRGCVVLILVAVAALAGYATGGVHSDRKWLTWTAASITHEFKGDRQ